MKSNFPSGGLGDGRRRDVVLGLAARLVSPAGSVRTVKPSSQGSPATASVDAAGVGAAAAVAHHVFEAVGALEAGVGRVGDAAVRVQHRAPVRGRGHAGRRKASKSGSVSLADHVDGVGVVARHGHRVVHRHRRLVGRRRARRAAARAGGSGVTAAQSLTGPAQASSRPRRHDAAHGDDAVVVGQAVEQVVLRERQRRRGGTRATRVLPKPQPWTPSVRSTQYSAAPGTPSS